MFHVGIYEAKTTLSEIIRRVQNGEECVITQRGNPVVTVKAVKRKKRDMATAMRKIRAHAKAHPINATLAEMIAWKNEGRR